MSSSPKIHDFNFQTDHSFKKKAIRSGGITMFTHFLDYGIQVGSTAIIARILDPSDYGLVAISLAITGFFYIFKSLGLSDATVQRDHITHQQVSNLFWINAVAGMLLTLFLFFMAPLITAIFDDFRLINIIRVSSTSFVISGLYTQQQALLRRAMRFSALAVNEVIGIFLSVIVALSMAFAGMGYWVLVIRPLVYVTSIAIGCWIMCKWRPGLPCRNSNVKPMLKFGLNTIAYYIVDYFAKNSDKALIGWKEGPAPLGYYSKAFQLFLAPVSQLTIPLSGVAVATLSKLHKEPEKYHSYYLNALHAIAFVGFPISMFLVANGKQLILLLLGAKWAGAAELFSILGLAGGIQLITSTRAWLFVSTGRTDRWFYTGLVASLVMCLFILTGLQFGTKGVAVGYTSFVYLSLIPSLWYAGAPIGLKFRQIFSVIWKTFIASFLAAVINWYIKRYISDFSHFTVLLLSTLIFSISYTVIVLALYGNTKPFISFLELLTIMFPDIKKGKLKQNRKNQFTVTQ